MPVVLGGHQAFPFGGHDRDMVGQRVPADQDTTGMYSRLADRTFQGFGKLDGLGDQGVHETAFLFPDQDFLYKPS